jgi:hypothetical protein
LFVTLLFYCRLDVDFTECLDAVNVEMRKAEEFDGLFELGQAAVHVVRRLLLTECV